MNRMRERHTILKAERKPPGLSVQAFRAFDHDRPDEEHWELIDGVPMMMASTFVHQRIASNLERVLNDALETHQPARAAYQRGGLNLKRNILALANFGLRCRVGDRYKGTQLHPRPARRTRRGHTAAPTAPAPR
jgi:hypothetical protein